MRRVLFLLPILLVSGLLFPALASELTDKARSDYSYQLSEYRREYQEFDVKRGQHESVQTFAAQEELVKEAREMLRQRAEVWRVYLQVLRTRLAEANGIELGVKSDLEKRVEETQKQIAEHRATLADINTKEKLLEEALVLEEMDGELEQLSYETMAYLSIGKLQEIHDMEMALSKRIKEQIPQQILEEQAQISRLRGFDQVEQTLEIAQNNLDEALKETRRFDSYSPQRAFSGFTERLIPAHEQLTRAHQLITELSIDIEL